MRVSVDQWEPPENPGRPGHGVYLGPERVEAINTEKCPRCGAGPMYMCVYVQVPIPRGYSRGGPAAERYRRSGTPTKVPHHERIEAMRHRKRKEDRVRHRKALERARAAMKPSADLMEAAHAMRQFDFAEHQRLGSWMRAYGDILVNAGNPVLGSCC